MNLNTGVGPAGQSLFQGLTRQQQVGSTANTYADIQGPQMVAAANRNRQAAMASAQTVEHSATQRFLAEQAEAASAQSLLAAHKANAMDLLARMMGATGPG